MKKATFLLRQFINLNPKSKIERRGFFMIRTKILCAAMIAIVSLVNLLGGDISAKSEYGRGSEFTFTMPLKYQGGQGNEEDTGD